jgi:hypothetical protein
MDNTQFSRFAPLLRDMTEAQLASETERPRRLLLGTGMAGGKRIDIAYFPVGHVNVDAQVVIVGLTPGRKQMRSHDSLHPEGPPTWAFANRLTSSAPCFVSRNNNSPRNAQAGSTGSAGRLVRRIGPLRWQFEDGRSGVGGLTCGKFVVGVNVDRLEGL